jgi:hypothetical protein
MNDGTISVREIMHAIANLDTLSSSLLGKGKSYDAILKEVLSYKHITERWPAMKDFEKKFNLKPGGARKLLDQIYITNVYVYTQTNKNPVRVSSAFRARSTFIT